MCWKKCVSFSSEATSVVQALFIQMINTITGIHRKYSVFLKITLQYLEMVHRSVHYFKYCWVIVKLLSLNACNSIDHV